MAIIKTPSTCYSWMDNVFYVQPHCVNCKSNLQIKRTFNINIVVLQCNDHNQGHPMTSVNQKPILIFYPKFLAPFEKFVFPSWLKCKRY